MKSKLSAALAARCVLARAGILFLVLSGTEASADSFGQNLVLNAVTLASSNAQTSGLTYSNGPVDLATTQAYDAPSVSASASINSVLFPPKIGSASSSMTYSIEFVGAPGQILVGVQAQGGVILDTTTANANGNAQATLSIGSTSGTVVAECVSSPVQLGRTRLPTFGKVVLTMTSLSHPTLSLTPAHLLALQPQPPAAASPYNTASRYLALRLLWSRCL